MKEKRNMVVGLFQRIFITSNAFMTNDLLTYASAGAYSFLLSALPIVLLVVAILIRIFGTSIERITELLSYAGVLTANIDITAFLESILSVKKIGFFEILVVLSIFLMARKFFASIQQGVRIIYRDRHTAKPIKENILVIGGEVLLLFLIVIMAAVLMTGKTVLAQLNAQDLITPLLFVLLKNALRVAPFLIVTIFLFFIYYFFPPVKPKYRQSLFSALGCTLSFMIVQFLFGSIINIARYNLVYGVLSNVIVLLFEVFVFFILFLFFAQFQYVNQHYECFLLSRLYLLPSYESKKIDDQIIRTMFITPPFFLSRYGVTKTKDEVIYKIGEKSTELYYIWAGCVELTMPNHVIEITRGKIFGEFSSIVGGRRTATAVCVTNAILLRIPAEIFRETIQIDGEMSRRTLQMISNYVMKKNAFPLSSETEVW